MAVTFLAATDSGAPAASPASCAKPAGVASGDKMLALLLDSTGSSSTLAAPSGWTQIGATNQDATLGWTSAIYYKDDLGTAGPYSFTSSTGGSATLEAVILGYRGAATGSVDANSYTRQSGGSTSQPSTGVTPSQAGDVISFMLATNFTGQGPWSPAGSYTSRLSGSAMYCMDRINAPSGATGTVTATSTGTITAAIWMIAVKAAATGHMHQRMVL